MACRYLYLDDDKSGVDSYIRAVALEPELSIEHEFPGSFDWELDRLRTILPDFDGLILDWRLDEKTNNDQRATFRAAALAQELRTRGTERELKEIPIVLWSTYRKMVGSYTGDNTSQDLFDWVWDKEQVVDAADDVRVKLVALAAGYSDILGQRGDRSSLGTMLGLAEDGDATAFLDPRMFERFGDKGTPAHDYARFILRSVINPTGPLIDEQHLAARLGISIASSPDWPRLLSVLEDSAEYEGVFSSGWRRWWMRHLERWWSDIVGAPEALGVMDAQSRVALLREKYRFDVKHAPAIIEDYSTVYWTICQGYHTPLDPINGFALSAAGREPWQESEYISEQAALERVVAFQLDPLEEPRYKALLASVSS